MVRTVNSKIRPTDDLEHYSNIGDNFLTRSSHYFL